MASEVSDPVDSKAELAPEASSSAGSQALEVAIQAHMIPLHLQFGVSRGFTIVRLSVAQWGHQLHTLQSVHMCAENIWGWG